MGETVLKQLTNETNRMLDQVIRDLRRLPYDAEIEYLESTGTQYVDTGVAPGTNFGFSIAFSVAALPGATSALFGARTSTNVNANAYCVMMRSTGDLRLDTTSSAQYSAAFSAGDHITYTYSKTATVVNGVSYTNGSRNAISRNFYLFAVNNNGTTMYGSIVQRYYAAKIYDGSTLIRDFIPVRLGTTGYLYDKVSGQLFGNAGTGEFVLGPDKKTTRDYVQDGLVAMWDGIENTRERA